MKIIFDLIIYNITHIQSVLPNLFLAAGVILVSSFLLKRISIKDEGYITFGVTTFFSLFLILSLGVMLVSPLPMWEGYGWLQCVSVFVSMVVLITCSVMDMQTSTIISLYPALGLFVQAVLNGISLTIHKVAGKGYLPDKEQGMSLLLVAVLLIICCSIRAFSVLDLILYLMILCTYALFPLSDTLFLCVVCITVSLFTAVAGVLIYWLPKRKKEGSKGRLEFPFTLHIGIGFLCSLLFI